MSFRYELSYAATTQQDWASWFDSSAPEPEVDEPNFELSVDVARDMLERGETCWQHPGWWRDVQDVLYDWVLSGQLVRARLTAEWLVATLANPIDRELVEWLEAIACGDFLAVFSGERCSWPREAEYYRCRLMWEMVREAEAVRLERDVRIGVAISLREGFAGDRGQGMD